MDSQELTRGQRRPLPDRRESVTQKLEMDGRRVFLTTGFYPDGQPGEIFISVEDSGVELRLAYDLISRLVSLGMQYGVPLDRIVGHMLFVQGEIAGQVLHHEQIKMAKSLPDLIGRELAIAYLGREDLAHVKKKGGVDAGSEG